MNIFNKLLTGPYFNQIFPDTLKLWVEIAGSTVFSYTAQREFIIQFIILQNYSKANNM